MKDLLHATHKGCGGTFREINIWGDIECDKCGESADRYSYSREEEWSRALTENKELRDTIRHLKDRLHNINSLSDVN